MRTKTFIHTSICLCMYTDTYRCHNVVQKSEGWLIQQFVCQWGFLDHFAQVILGFLHHSLIHLDHVSPFSLCGLDVCQWPFRGTGWCKISNFNDKLAICHILKLVGSEFYPIIRTTRKRTCQCPLREAHFSVCC